MPDAPVPSSTSDKTPTLFLKKGTAKPLHGGHPWVFADAIARAENAPKSGDEVRVVDDRGSVLGRGFYSPDSAIAVRLLTRADIPIGDALIESRIDEALRLRRDILKLGVADHSYVTSAPATAPAPSPEDLLSASDQQKLSDLDAQLAKIQLFAAQYGMDAMEETSELRMRREAILKSAGVTPKASSPALSVDSKSVSKTIGASTAFPKKADEPDRGVAVRSAPPLNKEAELPGAAQTTAYRLINSEGDGLGGLTVDVYGDYLSVQIGTAGMDRRRELILDVLEKKLTPKAILDRSDARSRQIEKLNPPQVGPLRGVAPDAPHAVWEYGVKMICDLRAGKSQKTGLYLDQRENRARFASLAAGRDVLDVFSYSGGFALHAARAGARSITLLESSEEALELAKTNLEQNHIDDGDLVNAEWAEGFKHLRENGKQFDLIVLDPPKFARNRENVGEAVSAYRDLNAQAVRLLAPGGLLFTCSCSGNVTETDFERAVAAGIRASGRRAVLLERRGAAPDHPVPPGFDQGRYLKCLVLQVV